MDEWEGRGDGRFDEFLGADDPGDAPAGEAEALGEAVDDQDVVFVDVHDVFLLGGSAWLSVLSEVGGHTAALMVVPSQSLV